jgi:formate hydrogenlyase subunit 3/multisubunit Na+/H+ antiporter MnhD subunit
MLGVLLAVALVGGAGSVALAARLLRVSVVVAFVSAVITLLASLLMQREAGLAIREVTLAGSDASRMLAVTWSAGLLLLGLIALATSDDDGDDLAAVATSIGAGLLALAAAVVAVTVGDPGIAFVVLGAGGVAAVVAPAVADWRGTRADEMPLREVGAALGACLGAALVAVVIVSWSQSSAGPLGSGGVAGGGSGVGLVLDPAAVRAAIGLAILAMAGAVILRSGAIPGHLWAARLVGEARPVTIPTILGWGAAAFTLLAVAWSRTVLASTALALDDLDRWIVIVAALASVLLGGLAALLHDDVEHIVGYSIVQDAGVALFAFAAVRTDVAAPLAAWVLGCAAVKAGFAGWITVARWTFGAHLVSELRGWARRAPVLGVAYAVALLATVGVPGMAIFDARIALVGGALPGWLGTVVVAVAMLSSLTALGRVLVRGLQGASSTVLAAPATRLGVLITRRVTRGTWSSGGWSGALRRWPSAGASLARGNQGVTVAAVTVLLAVVGFAVALLGAGKGLST